MTDYYPLIGKAVAGLEKNTGEARRALYERARTALVGQLRSMNPPLTEPEITRERLALEEAIRKVEAEAARRLRMEPPRAEASPTVRPGEPPPRDAVARRDAPSSRDMPPPREAEPPRAPSPAPRREASPPPSPRREPPPADNHGAGADMSSARVVRNRLLGKRGPTAEQGPRGYRDGVAEAENLGEKAAQAPKSARQGYASVPTDIPEFDRMEPRLDPVPPRPGQAREGTSRSRESTSREGGREAEPREAASWEAQGRDGRLLREPARDAPPQRQAEPPSRRTEPPRQTHVPVLDSRALESLRSRRGMVAALLTLFVILGVVICAYVLRDRIAALTGAMRGLGSQQHEEAQTRPKIPDRIGQDGQAATPGPGQTVPSQQQLPAVAQRVVLYEEDP